MDFFTIGVYNSLENDFFNKLVTNNIDTFCDIRQRRGVRGTKYAFVNHKRLITKLDNLGINYIYIPELAPTKEIRDLQKSIDLKNHELKCERNNLGEFFITEYTIKRVNSFDFSSFIEILRKNGAQNISLFCVEEFPEACHRSIVAQRLNEEFRFNIKHI